MLNDYGRRNLSLPEIHQANAIVERVHQTIGNIIRTFELHDNIWMDDPLEESGYNCILQSVLLTIPHCRNRAKMVVFGT
jgi:hypothetical protein